MKIAVLQFPGTNCEFETLVAVKTVGMEAEIFRWNRPAGELSSFDGFVIPGGFSYQDRVRAGAVLNMPGADAASEERAARAVLAARAFGRNNRNVAVGQHFPGGLQRLAIDLAAADGSVIAKAMDYSILPKQTRESDIRDGCRLARKYSFAAFYSSSPHWSPVVAEELAGTLGGVR